MSFRSANIQNFSVGMQKTVKFFVKKLRFPCFNKLYVPFSLAFALIFVISHQIIETTDYKYKSTNEENNTFVRRFMRSHGFYKL